MISQNKVDLKSSQTCLSSPLLIQGGLESDFMVEWSLKEQPNGHTLVKVRQLFNTSYSDTCEYQIIFVSTHRRVILVIGLDP